MSQMIMKIEHEEPHALDPFGISGEDVERLLRHLRSRNRLWSGEEAMRPVAMMTAFRDGPTRLENLERSLALVAALRQLKHRVLALVGDFDLAPLWLDDEDARWIPPRPHTRAELGLVVVGRKGVTQRAFEDELRALLSLEAYRQEAVALLGGGEVGVRLLFRNGRHEALGGLSWQRLGDAYSRLRHGTAETPFEVIGLLRPGSHTEGKTFGALGLSGAPERWAVEARPCIMEPPLVLDTGSPVALSHLLERLRTLAGRPTQKVRPPFAMFPYAGESNELLGHRPVYELRARYRDGVFGSEASDHIERLTLVVCAGPSAEPYPDFEHAILAFARRPLGQASVVLSDGETLWLVPSDGRPRESFGTSPHLDALSRACARMRQKGDQDYTLCGLRCPRHWRGKMVMSPYRWPW